MKLNVYVPKIGTTADLSIADGSGIVGKPTVDDRVHVYYEGNIYGAASLETYASRIFHAAGRMVENAPTIAQAMVPGDDLMLVGQFDYEARTLEVHDSEKIASWLSADYLDDDELVVLR